MVCQAHDLTQHRHCPSATELTLEKRAFICALGYDLRNDTGQDAQHMHADSLTHNRVDRQCGPEEKGGKAEREQDV